jgi:hypothetical protein
MNNHRAFLGSSPQGGYFDDFHYPKPIDTWRLHSRIHGPPIIILARKCPKLEMGIRLDSWRWHQVV